MGRGSNILKYYQKHEADVFNLRNILNDKKFQFLVKTNFVKFILKIIDFFTGMIYKNKIVFKI